MKGVALKIYTYECQKHDGMLMYEWLLEFAKNNKVHGASVFRAIAGYGRLGVIKEEHFFELASNVPVEVVLILTEEESERLLNLLRTETLDLFYTKSPIEYGTLKNE